jgi:hypothetical protein
VTKGWNAGDFLGKPFATAAKMVMQARYELAGKPSPATVDDIRETLLQGTYDFGTNNADQQKQGIRIALGKNTAVFVRLPNSDLFGLIEWYPGLKRTPRARPRLYLDESPTSGGEDAEPAPTSFQRESQTFHVDVVAVGGPGGDAQLVAPADQKALVRRG